MRRFVDARYGAPAIALHWLTAALVVANLTLGVSMRAPHPPPPPARMPVGQGRAADRSHLLLYALLTVIPLSGWLYSSSTGVQVVYLGLVSLPDLVPKDRTLATVLKWTHFGLNSTLLALVIVHAAAALKHHLIDRDSTLARMLPLAWTRSHRS
jgi:cytochrome b561